MTNPTALLVVLKDENGFEGTLELGKGKFEYRKRNGMIEISMSFPEYQTLNPKERFKEFKSMHNTWGNPTYLNNREERKEKNTTTKLTDFVEV